MGSSGAGKTTLLDVLAQRKTDGTINGEIMVDGRPLPVSFQRSAGYCEQLDVHEPYATVREALEFSALLRQSRETPRAEKLAYVDTIIDLLQLRDMEHTLIGKVGAGLSVEQRKRVTIGVELVSKPSILIFLDEPTSGLDGQAAFSTVQFLRKLADIGQAVLVTIHQPSAQLFAQFDTLLLLAKGGKTVYFGDIGDNAHSIKEYFGRHGCPCPEDANPAEHMIDVVNGSLSKGKDWHQVWLDSPEASFQKQELDHLISDAASKPPGTVDDGHEFATPMMEQTRLVTKRMNKALYRNIDYINNKVALHIGSALFNGFTFWMIGNGVNKQQEVLFACFNFIFVAPGVIAQLQPLFIERRDIYETREKKSKMYHWFPFTTALIVSEVPYLVICAIAYFLPFYYTVGFPSASSKAGAVFFVMLVYEFIYTGIGQFVAAPAPNAVFASLINPLLIGILVSFCGVLVPYAQIQAFWRYWVSFPFFLSKTITTPFQVNNTNTPSTALLPQSFQLLDGSTFSVRGLRPRDQMQGIRVRHLQPAARPILRRIPGPLPRRTRLPQQPRQPGRFRGVQGLPVYPRQRLSVHGQFERLLLWVAGCGDLRAVCFLGIRAGLCAYEG
jgi:ABC-type multidrug transport system ATPase subunit